MERERDIVMGDHQAEMDELRRDIRSLSQRLHRVEERDRTRHRRVEVIDLTGDDDVLDEPIVRVEREDTVVPESPQGTLVEIEEPVDGRSTPQIVGEAERAFARMEGREVLQEEMNEEANNLVER